MDLKALGSKFMKLLKGIPVSSDVRSDEDLMILVQQNHRDAFDTLYEKYKRPIMSYIYSMTLNRDQAEDLTQETFLKLFRARGTYQVSAKLSTFLWTIAKHTTFDHLAKKRELTNTTVEMPESIDDGPLADEALELEADEARVRECLSRLSPRARQIVNLRIFSEESYESISRITSETESTVKTILHRSKSSLVDCFKRGRT